MSNFVLTESLLLHSISSIFILATAVAAFYLLYKAKTMETKMFSLIFSVFAVTHGLYHVFFAVGLGDVGHVFFNSVSAVALMALGVYFVAHRSSLAVAALVPLVLLNATTYVTVAGLSTALILFAYSAVKTVGRRVRTFKFQMSLFLIAWIISELPRALGPVFNPSSLAYGSDGYSYGFGADYLIFGLRIHTIAMGLLWVLVYHRLGKYVWGRSG